MIASKRRDEIGALINAVQIFKEHLLESDRLRREIRYLRDIFGADDTIGVADIRHLPDRLGRILLRYARKH